MGELQALLWIREELDRARSKWPPFATQRAAMQQLRKQVSDLELAGASQNGARVRRELCQVVAVAIRMLAGV